jgi:hypothetical protein
MDKSETLEKLGEALAKAQGQILDAKRDSNNPFFKSRYADLASVWEACRKPLSDNGLAVIQTIELKEGKRYVTTMLLHNSGQYISSELDLTLKEETMQGIGSAITYARRYSLSALVGVAPDDDDDGEAANGRPLIKQVTTPTQDTKTVNKEHWCSVHNCAFIEMKGKDGKSRWWSHKSGDKWCNEKDINKSEEQLQDDSPEPVKESQPPAAPPVKPEKAKEPKEVKPVKTLGDLFTACTKNHSEHFATRQDVLDYLKKSEADIVDPAAEYAEIEKKLAA